MLTDEEAVGFVKKTTKQYYNENTPTKDKEIIKPIKKWLEKDKTFPDTETLCVKFEDYDGVVPVIHKEFSFNKSMDIEEIKKKTIEAINTIIEAEKKLISVMSDKDVLYSDMPLEVSVFFQSEGNCLATVRRTLNSSATPTMEDINILFTP